MARDIPLPHPGTLLKEEFLEPMGITVYRLSESIGVPRSRINEICRGRQRISAGIALRLGKFFGVDPQWFMNMQSKYDLESAASELVNEIARIETHHAEAA